MTTDDERPSGTGLRGAVERIEQGRRIKRPWPDGSIEAFVIGADEWRELRALILAAHPDPAAGTGPEKCGGCGSSWNLVAMGRPGPDQWWLHPDCGWRSKEASDDD